MTFPKCAAAQISGAIIAAALTAFTSQQAAAQTLANPKPAARPAPKPAPVTAPVHGYEQADYWTVNTSLPQQYSAERPRQQSQPRGGASTRTAPSERSPIDRVPLRDPAGSTIGFASGPTASSGRFSDGREVPGINANTRAEDSYVGLSLTTRSSSKGFIVPVPTPWSRPE